MWYYKVQGRRQVCRSGVVELQATNAEGLGTRLGVGGWDDDQITIVLPFWDSTTSQRYQPLDTYRYRHEQLNWSVLRVLALFHNPET